MVIYLLSIPEGVMRINHLSSKKVGKDITLTLNKQEFLRQAYEYVEKNNICEGFLYAEKVQPRLLVDVIPFPRPEDCVAVAKHLILESIYTYHPIHEIERDMINEWGGKNIYNNPSLEFILENGTIRKKLKYLLNYAKQRKKSISSGEIVDPYKINWGEKMPSVNFLLDIAFIGSLNGYIKIKDVETHPHNSSKQAYNVSVIY